jgi:predicted phage terminase large subunit-like protein
MNQRPLFEKFDTNMAVAVDGVSKLDSSAYQCAYMAAAKAMADWHRDAHDYQLEPLGDWSVWLFLAGRGAGKTRTAAETLRDWAWGISNSRWLVSAPTYSSLARVCFTGESGLLSVIPEEMIESFNSTDLILKLVNGAQIEGISAESKERFRGPQYHGGWCDELAAWQYAEEAWDLMMMGMRLGEHPRIIATTTPKPRPLIARLYKDPHTHVTVASTYQNLEHLAPTMRRELLKYEGTSYGRQEIYGELLDPEEAGIIKRSWIRLWPRDMPLPKFEFVLISLDTAYTEKTRDRKTGDADPTACVVAGLFRHKEKLGILVLECWEEWLGLPDLIRKVKDEMKISYGDDEQLPVYTAPGTPRRPASVGRKADLVLIEEKGSGISLVQMLQREGIYPWTYNPGRADKLLRLHQVSHLFKAGFFWVPESKANPGMPMSWTEGMVNQLCTFHGEGSTKHDDYVDAVTQMLRYFADQMEMAADAPPELPEDVIPQTAPVNVYAL